MTKLGKILFVLIGLTSVPAFAAGRKAIIWSKSPEAKHVYIKDPSNDYLNQITSDGHTQFTAIGLSFIPSFNFKTEPELIPGVTCNGHSRISLKNENNTVYLDADSQVAERYGLDTHITFKAPVEFVYGSYEDFLENKEVKFQLTKEGQEIAYNKILSAMQIALSQFSVPGATISERSLDKFKIKGNFLYQGNRTRLEEIFPPTSLKMSLWIY